jgi:predicted nucleic acid-binding protein
MPTASIVFVDTNVLLYADDTRDAVKQAQSRNWLLALWQRRSGRLSTQVLNEYYANVTRKLKLPQIDHQTVETAWGIEARFGLSYWDSLIVAAAAQAGCTHVLSEDMRHEQHYGVVQVINPFKADITMLDSL